MSHSPGRLKPSAETAPSARQERMLRVGVWELKLGEKAVHVEVEKQVFGGSMFAGPAETVGRGAAPVLWAHVFPHPFW